MLPVPTEITIQILRQLKSTDCWSFAASSRENYRIAREHVLFKNVKLGWWPTTPEEYVAALESFDPTSDPHEKLKEDVRALESLKIGSEIRELKVAFAEASTMDNALDPDRGFGDHGRNTFQPWSESLNIMMYDGMEAECAFRRLLSLTTNLKSVTVLGCHSVTFYMEVIHLLGRFCPQLEHLCVRWKWEYQNPDIGIFAFQVRFPNLKRLEIWLGVGLCYEDASRRSYLGRLVAPLIRASVSPSLHEIVVKVNTDIPDRGVEWTDLGVDIQLRRFDYSIYELDRPLTAKTVKDILIDMTAICKGLEEFSFHNQGRVEPLEFEKLLPWFAALTECKKLKLNIGAELPIQEYSIDWWTKKKESAASHALRRSFMKKLASLMPKIEQISWCDWQNDSVEGSSFEADMVVKRDPTGDKPNRIGFRYIPTINDYDSLEKTEQHQSEIDNTAYDFSESL